MNEWINKYINIENVRKHCLKLSFFPFNYSRIEGFCYEIMNTDNGNVNSEVKKAVGRGSRQALKIFNRADIWIYFQKQEKTKVI